MNNSGKDIRGIKPPLASFYSRLPKSLLPVTLIAFGSRVIGEHRPDSDIDVVVISSGFAGCSEQERWDIVSNKIHDIIPDIHPWPTTPEEFKKAHFSTVLGVAREYGVEVAFDEKSNSTRKIYKKK